MFARRTAGEIERVICQVEPSPPRISGDLDIIVLKALRKDPARRYPSVEALLEDIRRERTGMPVLARPDSPAYRVRKFIERHRAGVATAFAFGLALAGGLGATIWQARIARVEADRANAITQFVWRLFEISYPERSRGREVTARELLDEGARRVETELAGRPEIQASLLHLIGAVYRDMAMYPKADSLLRRATALSIAAFGHTHVEVANRAQAWGNVLYQQGEYVRAESVFSAALPIMRRARGSDHPETAGLVFNLAHAKRRLGEAFAAESLFRESLVINRAYYGDNHPAVAFDRYALGTTLRGMGRLIEAESVLVTALATQRRLFDEDHNDVLLTRHSLATVHAGLGRRMAAEVALRDVLARRRRKYPSGHPHVAATLHELAVMLEQSGQGAEAESLFVEALAMRRRILGEKHEDTRHTQATLLALRGRSSGR
jgi:serine/threonine-protein kinase